MKFTKDIPPSAKTLNEMARRSEASRPVRVEGVSGGIGAVVGSLGTLPAPDEKPIYLVRVTGEVEGGYSFTEQYSKDGNENYTDSPFGIRSIEDKIKLIAPNAMRLRVDDLVICRRQMTNPQNFEAMAKLGCGDGNTNPNPNGPVDEAGFTYICESQDEYGYGTGELLLRTRRADGSVKCIPLDPCCLSDWYCLQNEVIEGVCCDPYTPFKALKYVKVSFTDKTGAALELPDHAIFQHDIEGTGTSGEYRWFGRGTLGKGVVSGGLILECDSAYYYGEMVARFAVVGFESQGAYESGAVGVDCDWRKESQVLDFGVFDYTAFVPDRCGGITEQEGTVRVTVRPWATGDDPVTGVVEIPPGTAPPPDAGRAYKTEEEAAKCCPLTLSGCSRTFPAPRTVYLELQEVIARFNGASGNPFSSTPGNLISVPSSVAFRFGGTDTGTFPAPTHWYAPTGDGIFPPTAGPWPGTSAVNGPNGRHWFTITSTCGFPPVGTAFANPTCGSSPIRVRPADDTDPFLWANPPTNTVVQGWRFTLTLLFGSDTDPLVGITGDCPSPFGVVQWTKPWTNPLKMPKDDGMDNIIIDFFENPPGGGGKGWRVKARMSW